MRVILYRGAVAKWRTRRSAKPLCTGSIPVCASIRLLIAAAGFAAYFWAAEPAKVVIKNQGFLPFADAPIHYRSSDLNDPIAKLEKRLEQGDVTLHYEPQHGYLKSVLDALHVPVSSQALVFSKT